MCVCVCVVLCEGGENLFGVGLVLPPMFCGQSCSTCDVDFVGRVFC